MINKRKQISNSQRGFNAIAVVERKFTSSTRYSLRKEELPYHPNLRYRLNA